MATIDDFISYAQGKVFNNQGVVMNINYVQSVSPYGGQCVSLAQGYMKYFGCPVQARGNAIDWWRNFNSNGLSAYFTKSNTPVNGALIITNADPTYGHIGVYYNGYMLQQNYAGNPHARLLGIAGTPYGYLIPKFLSNYSDSKLVNEHAYATLKYDVQKRRDTPTGMAVEILKAGRKLEYTQKYVGNGHRYISWVEHQADGASYRYFVAVNGNEAGTEPWADFSPIEEVKPAQSIALTQEDGVAKFTVDGVRARFDSPTGTVCKTYNSGDAIRYYWKYVGNGHRYVVGKDGNKKVFVAVSATEDRSQMWATFSAPQEENKTEEPKKEESKPAETPTEDVKENTNGFSSVNEGEYEGHDVKDEVLELDGVTVDLISKNLYSYKCPYLMTPKTIIIHNAATPNGTAKALNNALHNSKEYKSWHFSVDDKNIIESLPLNRNAFGTGDGAYGLGNRTGVHIEIAKDNSDDSNEEWQKARSNGAKLAAQLLYKYGFDIDKLTKHQDYKMTNGTYKYCPHKILDEGWDDFKFLVESELETLKNPKKDEEVKSNESIQNPDYSKNNNATEDKKNKLLDLLIKLIQKLLKIFR